MLREQKEIYLKLADKVLDGLNVEDFRSILQQGDEYCSDEFVVGKTSYFLTFRISRLFSEKENSFYVCGYISTKQDLLILIRVRRSVNSNFLDVDKTTKETLAWIIDEFKEEIINS